MSFNKPLFRGCARSTLVKAKCDCSALGHSCHRIPDLSLKQQSVAAAAFHPLPQPALPEALLQKLIDGHKRFRSEIFPKRKGEFHLLAEGQQPEWLFITCSDSRVVPDLVLGSDPGDLFITRNAGNVVPITSYDVDGCTATIEYAVEVLGVKHAILCGHSDCGAMKAALDHTALEQLPKAERWLHHVEAAFSHRQPLNPNDGDGAELASLIRGNVVAQLMNLKVQPAVARELAAGKLTVHGWYYDILTGSIEEYDEEQKRFLPWPIVVEG